MKSFAETCGIHDEAREAAAHHTARLIEASDTGKYLVRQFTPREVADAIAVRGHLEGMAARLVAEHGVSRQLQGDLQACLEAGDRLLADNPLTLESYAAYAGMNDRFHALILDACGNRALQRAVALDRDWMLYAHRQHHMLFDALKRGEGTRAQNLAVEHTEVAQMNMRLALERRAESEQVMPAIRLVVG